MTYYFFSTSALLANVPVAVESAAELTPLGGGTPGFGLLDPAVRNESMPAPPSWAANTGVWAPSVARFGDQFVMYFAGRRKDPVPDPANPECVGRAFAAEPQGPFVAEDHAFWCGLGGVHGALDPFVFRAPTGAAYLLMAAGGTSTTLWTVPLGNDGGAVGPPVPLLRMQHPWEVWFNENPTMVFDGVDYVLAYSSGDWRTAKYSTGVARCRTPTGPCTSSSSGPWLSTTGNVSGPGGLSFFRDIRGHLMAVFHGYVNGQLGLFSGRHAFIRGVDLSPKEIALDDASVPSSTTDEATAPSSQAVSVP